MERMLMYAPECIFRLETTTAQLTPRKPLPQIKRGNRRKVLIVQQLPVHTDTLQLAWAQDFSPDDLREAHAKTDNSNYNFNISLRWLQIGADHRCTRLLPTRLLYTRTLWGLHHAGVYFAAVVHKEYTVEERTDVCLGAWAFQKSPRCTTAVLINQHVVHKLHLTQQLDQEVGLLDVDIAAPCSRSYSRKLRSVVVSQWQDEHRAADRDAMWARGDQTVDLVNVAPVDEHLVLEVADNSSIPYTPVYRADTRRVSAPRDISASTNQLFNEAMGQLVKDNNIEGAYYFRHYSTNDQDPHEVIIMPQSIVDARSKHRRPIDKCRKATGTPRPRAFEKAIPTRGPKTVYRTTTSNGSLTVTHDNNPKQRRMLAKLDQEHSEHQCKLETELARYMKMVNTGSHVDYDMSPYQD